MPLVVCIHAKPLMSARFEFPFTQCIGVSSRGECETAEPSCETLNGARRTPLNTGRSKFPQGCKVTILEGSCPRPLYGVLWEGTIRTRRPNSPASTERASGLTEARDLAVSMHTASVRRLAPENKEGRCVPPFEGGAAEAVRLRCVIPTDDAGRIRLGTSEVRLFQTRQRVTKRT